MGSNRESTKKKESPAQNAKAEAEQVRRDQEAYNLGVPKTHTTVAKQVPRNQRNLGPLSTVSPQKNGQLSRPPTDHPPVPRPHQMTNPIAHPLPNINANSRPPEQQYTSPYVAPPPPMSSTTRVPIPLSHEATVAQARSFPSPNLPRHFVPGHQPQDTAISGFNDVEGEIDVRVSLTSIHIQLDLIGVSL